MGWVTLDDGQHIYIGAGGEFQPRGPTAPKGAANRASGKGPGGMARTASGLNLHERMTASATAASTRAAAARARGDRQGELQAHEHRALIIAKQNDIKGVHKSGQGQVAPAGEKTAAAALVARIRGGGKAAEPAAPARGINAAFKASASPAEVKAAAQQRLAGREGMNRLRIAQGKARVGDYVQAPSGSVNVRRPALAEGRVVGKSPEGVLTLKRGDEKTFKVHAGEAQPVGAGQRRFTPERATKAAELRAGRAPAALAKPAPDRERTARIIAEARAGGAAAVAQRSKAVGMVGKPAAPSLREQAATVSPHALAGKMPIGKFAAGVNPSEIAKGYGLPHDFYTDARVTERGAGGFPSLRGEVHVSDKYDPKGEVAKAVDARQSAQQRGLYEGSRRKFYDQNVEKAIGSAAKRASRK